MDIVQESYIDKMITFDEETGCIPAGSTCFCYAFDGIYFLVCFREPILGRHELRLHANVINAHGRIVG